MEVIKEGKERIAKTWGEQKISDADYRLLKYLFRVDLKNGEQTDDDRQWLIAKQNELNAILEENKLYHSRDAHLPHLQTNHCMADNDGSVIISPDGNFAKCEHLCEGDPVGNLRDGFTEHDRLSEWKQTKEYPECETCPLLPNCVTLLECFSSTECFADKRCEKRRFCMALLVVACVTPTRKGIPYETEIRI